MDVPDSLRLLTIGVGQSIGCALALAAIAYLILALRSVWRWRELDRSNAAWRPPVTIMVPIYGAPPGLQDCLRSLCRQIYPEFQIIFGLHSPDDAGRAVIDLVRAEFPQLDTALVIDATRIGSNPKVCNLANMARAVKHDAIVMVDSDVKVGPRFLEIVTEPLGDPKVGGATCLYKAEPIGGLAAELGALYINDWFIPSALVDLAMREMDLCYGAVLVVSRHALDAIGGFAALADAVAEDDVLGEQLHGAGLEVRLARQIVTTLVTEANLRELLRHELRWMRSVRACRPRDHALSVVMYAFAPVAILVGLFPSALGLALLAGMLALRLWLHYLLRRRIHFPAPAAPWLLPIRDCLSFMLWAASFASRRMRWGTSSLEATDGRRMATRRTTREGETQ